ncbi:hypothetical protein DFJ77DRAFT_137064 [Powellomyces hirtus]|nr:hypothetical protein DFJ77DRAFT_137064 [Powellomyces hirtus]
MEGLGIGRLRAAAFRRKGSGAVATTLCVYLPPNSAIGASALGMSPSGTAVETANLALYRFSYSGSAFSGVPSFGRHYQTSVDRKEVLLKTSSAFVTRQIIRCSISLCSKRIVSGGSYRSNGMYHIQVSGLQHRYDATMIFLILLNRNIVFRTLYAAYNILHAFDHSAYMSNAQRNRERALHALHRRFRAIWMEAQKVPFEMDTSLPNDPDLALKEVEKKAMERRHNPAQDARQTTPRTRNSFLSVIYRGNILLLLVESPSAMITISDERLAVDLSTDNPDIVRI